MSNKTFLNGPSAEDPAITLHREEILEAEIRRHRQRLRNLASAVLADQQDVAIRMAKVMLRLLAEG